MQKFMNGRLRLSELLSLFGYEWFISDIHKCKSSFAIYDIDFRCVCNIYTFNKGTYFFIVGCSMIFSIATSRWNTLFYFTEWNTGIYVTFSYEYFIGIYVIIEDLVLRFRV